MNQSEFEANTCNRRQERKNEYNQDTIGLGLASCWLRKWQQLCRRIKACVVKQNQSKHKITFDSQLKTALTYCTN